MRELDKHGSGGERQRTREEEERITSRSEEPGRNFEQEVSDINTDPDAGYDFDLNPTDDREHKTSER